MVWYEHRGQIYYFYHYLPNKTWKLCQDKRLKSNKAIQIPRCCHFWLIKTSTSGGTWLVVWKPIIRSLPVHSVWLLGEGWESCAICGVFWSLKMGVKAFKLLKRRTFKELLSYNSLIQRAPQRNNFWVSEAPSQTFCETSTCWEV